MSIEEGSTSGIIHIGVAKKGICSFNRFIEIFKLVLYFLLIIVLAWSSYILWNSRTIVYKHQGEDTSFDALQSDRNSTAVLEGVEFTPTPKEALTSNVEDPINTRERSSLLNDKPGDREDPINTREISSFLDDKPDDRESTEGETAFSRDLLSILLDSFIQQNVDEATTMSTVFEDSVESFRNKKDDDDSKEDTDSKLDQILSELYDSNKNDDGDEVLESLQASYEKVNQDESDPVKQDDNSSFDEKISLLRDEIEQYNKLLDYTTLALKMVLNDLKKTSSMQELMTSDNPFWNNWSEKKSQEVSTLGSLYAEDVEPVNVSPEIYETPKWSDMYPEVYVSSNSREDGSSEDPKPIIDYEISKSQEDTSIASTIEGKRGNSVEEKLIEDVNDDSMNVTGDVEEGTVPFGPRIPYEDEYCQTQFIYGLKVVKCSRIKTNFEGTVATVSVEDMEHSKETSDISL